LRLELRSCLLYDADDLLVRASFLSVAVIGWTGTGAFTVLQKFALQIIIIIIL